MRRKKGGVNSKRQSRYFLKGIMEVYLRYKERILKYSSPKYFAGMILYFSLGNKYHRKPGKKERKRKERERE